MTPDDFVHGIRLSVYESSRRESIAALWEPLGRAKDPRLAALHSWYEHLSEEDQLKVDEIIDCAADLSTYGFLSVLDGIAFIERYRGEGATASVLRRWQVAHAPE
jgi:hypothetical protein